MPHTGMWKRPGQTEAATVWPQVPPICAYLNHGIRAFQPPPARAKAGSMGRLGHPTSSLSKVQSPQQEAQARKEIDEGQIKSRMAQPWLAA